MKIDSWGDANIADASHESDTPILSEVSRRRVFHVELSRDNRIMILAEDCDQNFCIGLNKEEAQTMVNELQAIVDKME